jgi:SAM-dependent methyltransferase
VTDHYADGTCQWWHLSPPSPELLAALGDGWLAPGGRVLDVGCGLGAEAGYLASAGWQAVGIDVSKAVIARTFAGWQIERMERAEVPSDTRMLDVLLARLATR